MINKILIQKSKHISDAWDIHTDPSFKGIAYSTIRLEKHDLEKSEKEQMLIIVNDIAKYLEDGINKGEYEIGENKRFGE